MHRIESISRLWLRRVGTCVMLLLLVNCAETAPQQYQMSTTTPHPLTTIQYYVKPVDNRHKQQEQEQLDDYYDYEEVKRPRPPYPTLKSPALTPAEFLMTVFRTAVDIVQNINKKRLASKKADNSTETNLVKSNTTTTVKLHRLQTIAKVRSDLGKNVTDIQKNATDKNSPRVMDAEHYTFDDHYPSHVIYEHPPEIVTTTTEKPIPVEVMKPRYADPWTGYYDFIINEGSFKFWSGFQLFTALLLLYSALAAIYYAKFNPITPDYDTTYDDYFFGRSLEDAAPAQPATSASPAPGWISSLAGMGSQTYQRIIDTLQNVEHKYT